MIKRIVTWMKKVQETHITEADAYALHVVLCLVEGEDYLDHPTSRGVWDTQKKYLARQFRMRGHMNWGDVMQCYRQQFSFDESRAVELFLYTGPGTLAVTTDLQLAAVLNRIALSLGWQLGPATEIETIEQP